MFCAIKTRPVTQADATARKRLYDRSQTALRPVVILVVFR